MRPHAHKQHFLACLSDPSRFSLISRLSRGPLCVTELATEIGLSQSCTTRHLQALLRAGIVTSERQGKRVVFAVSIAGPEAHPVLSWAFGDGTSASEAGLRRKATADGAVAHPDVAAEATRTSRARRAHRSGAGRAAQAPRRDEIEVTDALVVAHDSSWEEDDSRPVADLAPASDSLPAADGPPEELAHPDPGPVAARAPREQLDDFLL